MTDLQAPTPRDPEQAERTEAFQANLEQIDRRALGVALGTGAFALAAARPALGQSSMPSVEEVLRFALTLEYLERDFYQQGVDSGVIPNRYDAQGKYQEILAHEAAHVRLLEGALGLDDDEEQPEFDFTAGGTFTPFNDYTQFLVLSQGFEDTGVRAYKGGAPALMGNDVLTTALQIHSVEARHASVVRRLLVSEGIAMQDGWIEGDNSPNDAIDPVYAGGDNYPSEADTTVAGIDISGLSAPDGSNYSSELLTEAYDEPITMQGVYQIVDQFVPNADLDGDGDNAS